MVPPLGPGNREQYNPTENSEKNYGWTRSELEAVEAGAKRQSRR